jgi:hypothetical protein
LICKVLQGKRYPFVQVLAPASGETAAAADVPDFEREFFQNNSDEESESDASDSSGNLSEEEAKHF